MEMAIASTGRMVTIPMNAEPAVKDVFTALAAIITPPATRSETMNPAASAEPIPVLIVPTITMEIAAIKGFAIAVHLKNRFGVALTGVVLVCANMMLLANGNQHPTPK